MKVLVLSSLLCLLFLSVQSEIGFSLNGTFNPGFTIGSARKREARITEADQGDVEWPNPDNINHFPVPDSFANGPLDDVQNNFTDTITTPPHGRNSISRRHHHH